MTYTRASSILVCRPWYTRTVQNTEHKDAPLAISHATPEIESDEYEDDDDDEGSWESIDSNEEEGEEPKTAKEMIYDFFRKRS